MLIPCPHCGKRDRHEFTYGGDAVIKSPGLDELGQNKWVGHTYYRSNPRGTHLEYWQHSSGCRAWLVVERDTVSHMIASSRLIGPHRESGKGKEA